MIRLHRFVATCLLLVSTLHSVVGHACTATAPDIFSVGNKTADSSCSYGTIQEAINNATCAAGTEIRLNSSGNYTNQHLTITNKNIKLVGRPNTPLCSTAVAACGVPPLFLACPTAPLRTIDGNIKVRGTSNVTVQYLDITQGTGAPDGNGHTWGGGIDYAATGRLDVYTSTLEDNSANDGGGIRFQGYGGHADLYLHQHTLIANNQATNGGSGGGIRVEGDADLYANEPNIWIHGNKAADKGGGIVVVGPANAHIGSSGDIYFGSPVGVVSYNTAQNGGGLAAAPQAYGDVELDISASDPNRPVRIEHNTAYSKGGGIYLDSYADNSVDYGSSWGRATVRGGQIDDNAAPEGSGIYADTHSSLVNGDFGGEADFYAGACTAGVECNSVSYNRAVSTDSGGNETPTAGSAILLQTGGYFDGQQLAMRGNQGAHVIRVVDGLGAPLILDTCLLAGNTATAELITFGNAAAAVNQCTIANNVPGGAAMIRTNGDLTLTKSIFAQGAFTTLMETNSGAAKNLDYVMSMEVASLSGGTHIMQADPGFVDPGNGDFHLRANGPAVDVAPPVAGDDRDLDNRPRDQDLPDVPNIDGDRDLGAYERQVTACDATDTIFCNGFETN